MNLCDVSVVKIITPPHKVITDELCCWEVEVEVSTWGGKRRQILRRCSKSEIDLIKKGYWWSE